MACTTCGGGAKALSQTEDQSTNMTPAQKTKAVSDIVTLLPDDATPQDVRQICQMVQMMYPVPPAPPAPAPAAPAAPTAPAAGAKALG